MRLIAAAVTGSTVLAGGACLADGCETVMWQGRVGGVGLRRMPTAAAAACRMPLPPAREHRVAMALRRALEMLQAGERINDLLYRSTLEGRTLPPPLVQPVPLLASCPGCARSHGARDAAFARYAWLGVQPAT